MQSKQSSFQNPNPKGEIFSSLSSSYTFSGFDSSIQNGNERTLDDNSFSSPSMSRLVHEKNTSSSGLSKPRLVKVRKHLVSSSKGRKVDSGVYNNFFPPASGTSSNGELNGVNPFASNSAEKFDFVFGYDGVSANSNSKTSGLGENVGKSLPDEMMKLNIGRGMNDRVNSNTAGVSDKHETRDFAFGSNMGVPELNPKISGLDDSVGSLPADMRKLNVGKETNDWVNLNSGGVSDKYETRNFAFGSNMRVPELNPKMPGLGDSVGSLPADMRKLNIGKETNDRVNLNLGVGSEKHDNAGFVFGVSQRNSNSSGLDESAGESLSDSIRTLNIGKEANERVVNLKSDEVSKTHSFVFGSSSEGKSVSDRNKASDPATSEKCNDGSKIDEKTFVFGISKKLPDSVPQNTIDKLPNKLNKMKIEDYTVGSEKTKDGSLNSRSSDSFSTSSKSFTDSANGIPGGKLIGEMEKLNVQGSSGVEPQIKSQFFQFGEKKTFDFGSNTNAGSFGGPPVSTVLGEIGKLNIGSTVGGSGIFYDSIGGSSKPPSFTFQGGVQGNSGVAYSEFKLGEASVPSTATAFGSAANNFEIPSVNEANNKPDLNNRSSHGGFGTPQFRAPKQDTSRSFVASVPISTPSSSFSSAAPGVGSVGTTSGVPFLGGDEKKKDFTFISSQDGYGTPNFRAPNQDNLATGFKNLEISARKGGKDTKLHRRKGKAKQNTPVLQRPGKSFVSRESSSEVNTESPGAYSPMDFSPYEETLADDRSSREASMASDEFFNSDIKLPSTDAINARNEASVTAPGNPNISEGDMKCGELNDSRSWSFKRSDGAKCTTEEFISRPESEFMRSTSEKVDLDVDASLGKFGANTSINIEKKMGGESREFCFSSSSENVSNTSFAFAASPSVQGNSSAPKRLYKKKSQRKVGQDSQLSSSNANINFVIPGIPTFPLSGIGSHSTPGRDKMEESSSFQVTKENHQSETVKKAEGKEISTSGATKVDTAQEACEKWRLRGNQAYAKGNLSKAESYYTRGVNSVAAKDASKSCLNALVLCYSNRAATRMTLGRMREALEDCRAAMLLDPNFLKIQVRAANCHLALGEIEDALRFFRKGVQLGDVCLDRKVVIEASDGLQKAQKIAGDIDRCTELLQQRKSCDAESALTIINEALIILPYCEKIVQMKAEALFMMRRYEEVVQVCEQTLGSASSNVGVQSENTVGPESIKNSHTRLWCWFMISKSYYNLGRLEEALDFLDKLERVGPIAEKDGTDILKSSISLSVTVRELLRHKTAGNEAFQSGKYSEAVEHYTAAVSCSVESRPFAAICFCNRAAAYQAIGQITDAIADCSLSIALNGDYPKAISRRATLHEMIRDYGKATSDLQRLVSVLENKAEDKANQAGKLGRSSSSSNDLRQARSRLSTMEEEARKEIPLNMYLILGVEPSVDASDIKKAYRKAALRHHPDKAGQFLARSENGDDRLWKEIAEEVHKDADRLFKIIGEAYAILSDSTKRSRYDLEEEIRNSRKRGSGNNSPRRSEPSPYDRSGSSRRQWDEFRKSYQSAHWSRSSGRYYDF